MSAVSKGNAGVAAVNEKHYDDAIPQLEEATAVVKSPIWLIALSKAYQHTNQLQKALAAAETAYKASLERAVRKQMIEALYRRAVLLYKLGRYADSDCCAKWSQMLVTGSRPSDLVSYLATGIIDEDGLYNVTVEDVKKSQNPKTPSILDAIHTAMEHGNSQASTGSENHSEQRTSPEWNRAFQWRVQALGALKNLPRNDPARMVTVTPDGYDASAIQAASKTRPIAPKPVVSSPTPAVPVQTSAVDKARIDAALNPLKPRVDFYQTQNTVCVSLYIRNVNKLVTKVEFGRNKITIGPLVPEAESIIKQFWIYITPAEPIIPSGSWYRVSDRKIELTLNKNSPGARWPNYWGTMNLEGESNSIPPDLESTNQSSSSEPAAPTPVFRPAVEADISSSNDGATSVDTKASAGKTPSAPATARAEGKQPSGPPAYPTSSRHGPKDWDHIDAGDAAEEEGDVNAFFKKLYAGATPEQQRAMMKSFTESNGTALSTDWNDVKSRKVETLPPEGVEAKKWDK